MLRPYVIFLSFVGIKCLVTTVNGQPQVETKIGKVEGTWRTSFNGRKYAAFEGIPYAKPPIGDLRFKEPEPIESWSGVWNATRTYVCIQATLHLGQVTGDEDCLYINVYVPKSENEKLLDVVAHIHGGAFMIGSAQEFIGDKYVMDRDLVIVSFNYRLGALGFLSTDDEVVPGNNGLKDQALALKWIQDNIEAFGGNPKSVTLTGFSAGAASVHFHYLSPYSKGLFHRGWSASGTALGKWTLQEEPLKTARSLAQIVGCDLKETEKMVECLKTRPASLLVEKTKLCLHTFGLLPCCPLSPVIEKRGKKPFLADHPYNLLKQGKVYDVPWISSVTKDDGLVISAMVRTIMDETNEKWNEIAGQHLLEYFRSAPQIFDKVKRHYDNDNDGTLNFEELTKIATDRTFFVPMQTSVELQSKVTKSPIYVYRFNYEGSNSLKALLMLPQEDKGACHGDDLIYFLGGIIFIPLSEQEVKLKDVCMDILYAYASKGVPSINGAKWEPVRKEFVYYDINGADDIQKRVETDFHIKKFWDSLELVENDKLTTKKDEL
ncbi:unnamed protein product [Acanthoscelides obtectus]|uniref:Carboxylic ester hydrolase n=2 Tax=Acanthoscelides obtectus TaxID=200917 RepID=A0A9P0M0L2_ACAOB|nr:unnamed protein product [Acanthoscelides obtectus]CAK1644052.1 hypothetical protein AOBTE_LOCUS13799 [Acanthoscelides obtectus]